MEIRSKSPEELELQMEKVIHLTHETKNTLTTLRRAPQARRYGEKILPLNELVRTPVDALRERFGEQVYQAYLQEVRTVARVKVVEDKPDGFHSSYLVERYFGYRITQSMTALKEQAIREHPELVVLVPVQNSRPYSKRYVDHYHPDFIGRLRLLNDDYELTLRKEKAELNGGGDLYNYLRSDCGWVDESDLAHTLNLSLLEFHDVLENISALKPEHVKRFTQEEVGFFSGAYLVSPELAKWIRFYYPDQNDAVDEE